MFSVKIYGVNFGVTFSFFAVTALILLWGKENVQTFLCCISCCFLHEIGHLFFMFLFDERPQSVTLYGGGIRITPKVSFCCNLWREFLVLSGGIIFNFLVGISVYFLNGNVFFCLINLFMGAFNLMPFSYFDGGRILQLLFGKSKMVKAVKFLFVFGGIVIVIFMIIVDKVNFSLVAVICVVTFSDVICEIRAKCIKKRGEIPQKLQLKKMR